MTDSIDSNQLHMSKPDRSSKYSKCDHCGMYCSTRGACPFCGKGVVR